MAEPYDLETMRAFESAFEEHSLFVDKDGLRAVRERNRPFFAIMYRDRSRSFYFDTRVGRDCASEEEDEKGWEEEEEGRLLVRSLWDYVVNAWVPDLQPRRLGFGTVAYKFFEEDTKDVLCLEAYSLGNYEPPAACPERFKKYFEVER